MWLAIGQTFCMMQYNLLSHRKGGLSKNQRRKQQQQLAMTAALVRSGDLAALALYAASYCLAQFRIASSIV